MSALFTYGAQYLLDMEYRNEWSLLEHSGIPSTEVMVLQSSSLYVSYLQYDQL